MISKLVVSYIAILNRIKYPVLVFWLGILVLSAFYAIDLPSRVSSTMDPPESTPSYIAKKLYEDSFPTMNGNTPFVLFVQSLKGTPLPNVTNYKTFDRALQYYAYSGKLTTPEGGYKKANSEQSVQKIRGVAYSSYYAVLDAGLPPYSARSYLSAETHNAKIIATFPQPATSESTADFGRELISAANTLKEKFGLTDQISVHEFGRLPFTEAISSATGKDIVTMFGIVLPAALCVFGFSLSSVRFLIAPVSTLFTSLSVSFAMMDGVAHATSVNAMAPGVCAALTLALVLDYTYFIMCKFRKQVQNAGIIREEIIVPLLELVVSSAGRTVFTSALAISACALGLIPFPIEMFRSIGYSCIVSSLSAMLVALNLVPALLLSFPVFFMHGTDPCIDEEPDNEDTHMSGVFQPLYIDAPFESVDEDGSTRTPTSIRCSKIDLDGTAANEGTALSRSSARRMNSQARGGAAAASAPRSLPQNNSLSSLPANNSQTHLAPDSRQVPLSTSSAGSTPRGEYLVATNDRTRLSTNMTHRSTTSSIPEKHNVSRHYRMVEYLTRFPRNIIAIGVVLAISLAPIIFAFDSNNISNGMTQFVPRNSELLAPWDRMQEVFAAGDVFPYQLVIEFKDYDYNANQLAFTTGQELVQELIQHFPQDLKPQNIAGGFYDGGAYLTDPKLVNLTYANVSTCIGDVQKHGIAGVSPDCQYEYLLSTVIFATTVNFKMTYLLISTQFDPTSNQGVNFYHGMLALMPVLEDKYKLKLWLAGYGCETEDIVSFASDSLPKIAAIVASILFVFVALAFGSLGVPLRAVVTVSLVVMFSFGWVNIVYVQKALSFFGWSGVEGLGSVAWAVPFASFLLVVGISLNYTLISTIRVLEFHWLGVPTRHAIRFGAADTGREITVAALMMLIIFFGLLFSEVPAMNELGMYLVCTALVSGMLYRLFFTPPLMSLLGEKNWWPMNACNSFMGKLKLAPLVLPAGAAKTRGSLAPGHDQFRERDEGVTQEAVYRSSQLGGGVE